MRSRSVIFIALLASAGGQSERASQPVQDDVAASSAVNVSVLPSSVCEAAVANELRGKTDRFALRFRKSG
jgi:predicted methyltransferase